MNLRTGLATGAISLAMISVPAQMPASAAGHAKHDLMHQIKELVKDSKAADAIHKRRTAMRALGGNMKKIGLYLKKGQGDAATVSESARNIAGIAKAMPGLFPAGTSMDNYTGATGAKAAIWQNHGEFKTAAATLGSLAESLAKVASAPGANKGGIGKAFGAMGKMGCGGCHRSFRQKLN